MELLDLPLGKIARQLAGATQVFHRHQLDFCCNGQHTLRDAAQRSGQDATAIAQELQQLQTFANSDEKDWTQASAMELIDHILERFHERHREQLPELRRLAQRVETVHGDREDCPRGLADLLANMQLELDQHMDKEEQVLFPMLAKDMKDLAGGAISVMRFEHDQHGEHLRQLSELTNDYTPPRAACTTWRALYLGLRTLRDDLMEHIHLENNILFAGA